jgi:hypothetical protein
VDSTGRLTARIDSAAAVNAPSGKAGRAESSALLAKLATFPRLRHLIKGWLGKFLEHRIADKRILRIIGK